MADHGHSSSQPTLSGMDAARATYDGFLKWSTMTALVCLYVLIALVTFRFMDFPMNLFVGFGGLIVGIIVSLIALRMGGKWLLPLIVLVLYGLFVGNSIHMS